MTEDEVRAMLDTACQELGSQAEFARRAGVSAQLVSQVLIGRNTPGSQILELLGLREIGKKYERTGKPSYNTKIPARDRRKRKN